MADADDRHAACGGIRHDRSHLGCVVVVETGIYLVGQQHLRIGEQCAGQGHAGRLAAGQVVRGALQIDVLAAHRVQRRADALVGQQLLGLAALAANRERPGQADRLGHVLARQNRLLRQVGDIPPPLLRRELAAALAFKGERAVRMRVEPGARGQQTRLAGAGRSHQIDDLAALHGKGQVLEHSAFVVCLRLRGDDAGHGYGFEEGSHIHPV